MGKLTVDDWNSRSARYLIPSAVRRDLSEIYRETCVETNRWVTWTLTGLSLLWGAAGLAGAIPAMFSVMMFDSPESVTNLAVIAAALSIFTFPVVCLFTIVASWVAYGRGNARKACRLMALPLANVAVCGAAIAWIELVQNGNFAG